MFLADLAHATYVQAVKLITISWILEPGLSFNVITAGNEAQLLGVGCIHVM